MTTQTGMTGNPLVMRQPPTQQIWTMWARELAKYVHYPVTAAEEAAGVSPVDWTYPPGNVRRYGARGDGITDDTTALQSAANVARYNAGVVYLPTINAGSQTVYLAHTVVVYSNTTVIADDGVLVRNNYSSAATSHDKYVFNVIGVLGSGTNLTANGNIGDQTVAVTSAAGLTVGQMVMIRDATYVSGTSGRTQELDIITTIVGTTIGLETSLINAYATASTAQLVPFTSERKNIWFRGVKLDANALSGAGGFWFENAYDCHVVDGGCKNMQGNGAQIQSSAYCTIDQGSYTDGNTPSSVGTSYGFHFIEACHSCFARGVYTRAVRENAMSYATKFSGFENCTDEYSYDNSYNTHATGVQDCWIDGCSSTGARSKGIIVGFGGGVAGDIRIRVTNNKISYSGSYAISCSADAGKENTDTYIAWNSVYSPAVTSSVDAMLVSRGIRTQVLGNTVNGVNNNVLSGIQASGGQDVVIRGNTFYNIPNGKGVIHQAITNVTIDDNTFLSISADNVSGIATVSTGAVIRNNRMDDTTNTFNTGDVVSGNSPAVPILTVASAATVTFPHIGSSFLISGTTTITSVTATGWDGQTATLVFQGALTFTDGSNLKLAGNFVTTADDSITLACDGTNWYEIGRSVN